MEIIHRDYLCDREWCIEIYRETACVWERRMVMYFETDCLFVNGREVWQCT